MDLTGLAAVIGSIAALTTAVGILVTNWNVRRVKEIAVSTHIKASEIDAAVNGKAPRAATISEVVDRIDAKQERDAPSSGEVGILPMVRELSSTIAKMQTQLDAISKKKG